MYLVKQRLEATWLIDVNLDGFVASFLGNLIKIISGLV